MLTHPLPLLPHTIKASAGLSQPTKEVEEWSNLHTQAPPCPLLGAQLP